MISRLIPCASALLLCWTTGSQAQSSGSPSFADPERVARLSAAFPEIDQLMQGFAERSHVPGIAYGIIVDGRLAHVGTSGLREVRSGAPVERSSVFRIASMTKSFTALAILRLRDEGRLSLDDPAERYVPELAGLAYPTSDAPRITIRHLLSHSAGFPEDNPWGDQQLAITEGEMTAMLREGIPFSTAPGTAYEYSNYGFAILGRIVASVAGVPYAEYVREQILEPLGMSETTLEVGEVPAERLAHGYRWQDGEWLEEQPLPDGAFGSMGGMLTSVADLGRYVAFMLDAWPARAGREEGPVRRASVRELQQVARAVPATALLDDGGELALNAGGYGYGLRVAQTCSFRALVQHSGGLPGYGSVMRWLPEHGVGIVAMGNLTYTGWTPVTSQALELLQRTGALVPRTPAPADVLVERRSQVTRLVTSWDDALAGEIAAVNLFRDESSERRRAAIEVLRRQAGEGCREQGPFQVENALRGRWRLRCRSGDLRVAITLSPEVPAKVQFLEITPLGREDSLAPPPACRP